MIQERNQFIEKLFEEFISSLQNMEPNEEELYKIETMARGLEASAKLWKLLLKEKNEKENAKRDTEEKDQESSKEVQGFTVEGSGD